jgi:cytochrome P450
VHRVRAPFTKSSFYAVPARFQSMFSTRDPEFHSQRRRLLGPYFTEVSLSTFEPVVTDLVRLAVRGVVEESNRSGYADILKWWTLMAMDVVAELSFGESFDMVRSGKVSV